MRRASVLVWLLLIAGSPASAAPEPPEDMAELRRLHARVLERGPAVDDLSADERVFFLSCRKDPEGEHCRWGKEHLSDEQWQNIDAVEAELARYSAELRVLLETCARRDEERLRSLYPGRLDFYERVVAPRPDVPLRTDAIVVVSHGAPSMRRIRKMLDAGLADMALRVQVRRGGGGIHPSKHSTLGQPDFHYGWYTPEIERLMEQPRPDCDRLKNSAFRQAACRRDQTLAIVRDWMRAHGHRSLRLQIPDQVSWPEYALVAERVLPEFDVTIDDSFRRKLDRGTSFFREMCLPIGDGLIWQEYESYVRRLLDDD